MTSQSPETKITFTSPVRAPSAVPVDDAVIPFEVNALDLRWQSSEKKRAVRCTYFNNQDVTRLM